MSENEWNKHKLVYVHTKLYLIYSETPIILDNQEKADFISNFLLWTQGNDTENRKNCLILNFGAKELDLGVSQIRKVLLELNKMKKYYAFVLIVF